MVEYFSRYNQVVLSMLIMKLLDLMRKLSWMVKRSDKATLCSQRAKQESTGFVSTMK
jgi:hypothetical protein